MFASSTSSMAPTTPMSAQTAQQQQQQQQQLDEKEDGTSSGAAASSPSAAGSIPTISSLAGAASGSERPLATPRGSFIISPFAAAAGATPVSPLPLAASAAAAATSTPPLSGRRPGSSGGGGGDIDWAALDVEKSSGYGVTRPHVRRESRAPPGAGALSARGHHRPSASIGGGGGSMSLAPHGSHAQQQPHSARIKVTNHSNARSNSTHFTPHPPPIPVSPGFLPRVRDS
jgi:hypothetical protein